MKPEAQDGTPQNSHPSPTQDLVLRCQDCRAERIETVPLNIPVTDLCRLLDKANYCPLCGHHLRMVILTGKDYTDTLTRLQLMPPSSPS